MKTFKKSIGYFVILLFAVGFSIQSIGQPVPNNPGLKRLVVDEAGVFTSQEAAYLERELIAFSDTTSNQIVVVTMLDFEGYDKWEVAQNIGQKWGIGQSDSDNGVVILIKPKTRNSKGQIAIQVGYGLEGAIPDATAKLIVEREIIPYFKQGRMLDGVESGLRTIKALAVGEYNSDAYAANTSEQMPWFPLVFIVIVLILSFIGKARSAKSYSVGHNVPFWTALMLMNAGRGHGGSFGNFTSGGGGFGGFGGGGFGGGGAGGSW